jgi:hypothetical protein
MNEAVVLEKVEELTKTVEELPQRIENLKDLRDLLAAIAENGNEPLIPWDKPRRSWNSTERRKHNRRPELLGIHPPFSFLGMTRREVAPESRLPLRLWRAK